MTLILVLVVVVVVIVVAHNRVCGSRGASMQQKPMCHQRISGGVTPRLNGSDTDLALDSERRPSLCVLKSLVAHAVFVVALGCQFIVCGQ